MDTEFLDRNVGDDSLVITNDIRSFLTETAKWAKFIAIVGFIFIVLMVIISFFIGAMMGSMGDEFGAAGMGAVSGPFITIIYVLMALLYVMPVLYLYKFSDKLKKALATNNQDILNESFKYLKSHYKFVGILMAIFIGLYLVLFLIGGIGYLFAS